MPKPDYTALDLPPAPPDRPYVLINMVMSVDGKVVVEGTEQGIGSKVDQRLMRELRVNADVVMNGANTLRVSGSSPRVGDPILEAVRAQRGKSSSPIGAVVSRSGDLPLDRIFFTARDFDAVVYLSEMTPPERVTAIAATGRKVVQLPVQDDMPTMLRHMRHELGAEVLLVEGGPDLNAQLFAGGFVDEYFFTLGPVIVGGRHMLTAVGGDESFDREHLKRLRLVSAVPNEATDELYLRYQVRH